MVVRSREGGTDAVSLMSTQLSNEMIFSQEWQAKTRRYLVVLVPCRYIALATDEPHTLQSPSIKGLRWALFI